MKNQEVITELERLKQIYLSGIKTVDKKKMRDSEKAMTKAYYARTVSALNVAIAALNKETNV